MDTENSLVKIVTIVYLRESNKFNTKNVIKYTKKKKSAKPLHFEW